MTEILYIRYIVYKKNIQSRLTIAIVNDLEIFYGRLSHPPMKVKYIGLCVVIPHGSFVM